MRRVHPLRAAKLFRRLLTRSHDALGRLPLVPFVISLADLLVPLFNFRMIFSMMSKGGMNRHLYARLGCHIKGELSTLTRSKESLVCFTMHHLRGNFD